MIVLGYRGEDVYGGSLTGFYVCECVDVYPYVYLYRGVDEFVGHYVGFCVVCLATYIQD